MFDIITKKEYWKALDSKLVSPHHHSLKNIQDAFILQQLHSVKNKAILEIGAGDSRVISSIAPENNCWIIDKFEGENNGLIGLPEVEQVHIVKDFVGNFSNKLPNDFFDYIFSISVIEHIKTKDLENFFKDCARILKPGGKMTHAIDIYITDKDENKTYPNVSKYLEILLDQNYPLNFVCPPAINQNVSYQCTYASNPNNQLYSWNKIAPKLATIREVYESVSIKIEMIKN